jgi:aminopeptidase N
MPAARLGRDVLPDDIKPINYNLSIYDLELGGSFTYQGTVSILAKILRSTNEIVLNSHQLIIHSAEVTIEQAKSQQTFKTSGIWFDVPRNRATISFQDALPVSDRALITLTFQGTMNNDMAGFSRARYKSAITPPASVPTDGDHHLMFSTQFEACDARRAFPCFDEPNLKATFDFEVEIPSDLVALSNMPEKGTRKTKDGFHAVSFERTPVMSTYLLAWAIGDFEYIEDFTKRKYNGKSLPVRVYTTRGLKNQAQYALSNAPQVIDYFSEVFGIDYPLPKADLLAVHEFVSDFPIGVRPSEFGFTPFCLVQGFLCSHIS